MEARTLVLTPWYLPYRVVCWQDAITMMCLEKVDLVVPYNGEVNSPSTTMPLPAVIRMRSKQAAHRYRIRFSRQNVFMRDEYKCMYCGTPKRACELTFDHVVPRSKGGKTDWDNILSACQRCNSKKANRTPAEAGMQPVHRPYKPKALPMRRPKIDPATVPAEWRDFCAAPNSAWAR